MILKVSPSLDGSGGSVNAEGALLPTSKATSCAMTCSPQSLGHAPGGLGDLWSFRHEATSPCQHGSRRSCSPVVGAFDGGPRVGPEHLVDVLLRTRGSESGLRGAGTVAPAVTPSPANYLVQGLDQGLDEPLPVVSINHASPDLGDTGEVTEGSPDGACGPPSTTQGTVTRRGSVRGQRVPAVPRHLPQALPTSSLFSSSSSASRKSSVTGSRKLMICRQRGRHGKDSGLPQPPLSPDKLLTACAGQLRPPCARVGVTPGAQHPLKQNGDRNSPVPAALTPVMS